MAIGFTNLGNSGGGVKGLTASPAEVKQGYTFSRDGKTIESGTLNLSNLRLENVKSGVNIGGVVGNYSAEITCSAIYTSKYTKQKDFTFGNHRGWRTFIKGSFKFTSNIRVPYPFTSGYYTIYKNGTKLIYDNFSENANTTCNHIIDCEPGDSFTFKQNGLIMGPRITFYLPESAELISSY